MEPVAKRRRLEVEVSTTQFHQQEPDDVLGFAGGVLRKLPYMDTYYNRTERKSYDELRITFIEGKCEESIVCRGEWARSVLPYLVLGDEFKVYKHKCKTNILPDDKEHGLWRREVIFERGFTTQGRDGCNTFYEDEVTGPPPPTRRPVLVPQPVNVSPGPSRSAASAYPTPEHRHVRRASQQQSVEQSPAPLPSGAYPEVIIRRTTSRSDKPELVTTFAELPALCQENFSSRKWSKDSTYIDIVGKVNTYTLRPKTPRCDAMLAFSVISAKDDAPLEVRAFFKTGGEIPCPPMVTHCPIALINLRWDTTSAEGHLVAPSHKWPYTCWLGLDSNAQRIVSKHIGEIRMPEMEIKRIFDQLGQLRNATLAEAPDIWSYEVPQEAQEIERAIKAPSAPGVDRQHLQLNSRAFNPLYPPYQPAREEPIAREESVGTPITLLQNAVPNIRNAEVEILVEIKAYATRNTRLGACYWLIVTDYTSNDRLEKSNDWNDPPNQMGLSIVGDKLCAYVDKTGLIQRHLNGEHLLVRFTKVWISQKAGMPMDGFLKEGRGGQLPAFHIMTEEERENLPECRDFAARRRHFHEEPVMSSRPTGTQRAAEDKTHTTTKDTGLPTRSLKEALALDENTQCRVNVRCNSFKPDMSALALFRKLSCRDCSSPVPKKALLSPCTGCGAEHDWTKPDGEPCCGSSWPSIPVGGFERCDRCDWKIEVSYSFRLRVVEAEQNAGNIKDKPISLVVFGEDGNKFVGVDADKITGHELRGRLQKLMDGDCILSLLVQNIRIGDKAHLKVSGLVK